MIVITGAAGFIASFLAKELKERGVLDLILVDDFSREAKLRNHSQFPELQKIDRNHFIEWLKQNASKVDFVIHLGARTDTTEMNVDLLTELNVEYSKKIWEICTEFQIPLVYASSAATYGEGELGYDDAHDIVEQLQPLNPYGVSKNDFDRWVLKQESTPPFWAGLKFFNVYGPNEYHKGRMASVIFHAFHQIRNNGEMKLFRSHREGYADGHQSRDFVYVKDVVSVIHFLMEQQPKSGIYNLGSGKARTFLDLALSTFKAFGKEPNISFIDTPVDIRDKYQYFTEANMQKLKQVGYSKPFYSLEDGVEDYVKNYLLLQ